MNSAESARKPEHPLSSVPVNVSRTVRQRVILAAVKQIDQDPQAELRATEVAARARVSEQELRAEFPDYASLLLAVLAYIDAEWGADIFLGDNARGWPGLMNSENFLTNSVKRPNLARFFVRIQGEAVAEDHPAHEWLLNNYRVAGELGNFTFVTGQQDGTVSPDLDVNIAPIALNSLVNGLRTYALATGRTDLMEQAMHFISDAIEHKYRTGPDPQ